MTRAEQLIFFMFVDFGGVGTGEDEGTGRRPLPPPPHPCRRLYSRAGCEAEKCLYDV